MTDKERAAAAQAHWDQHHMEWVPPTISGYCNRHQQQQFDTFIVAAACVCVCVLCGSGVIVRTVSLHFVKRRTNEVERERERERKDGRKR